MINRNLSLLFAAIFALLLGTDATAERRDNPGEGQRGNRSEESRPDDYRSEYRPEYRPRERRPDERRPDEFRPDERREDRSREFGNRDRSNREFGTPDRLVRPPESQWQSGRRFPRDEPRDPGRNSGLDERVVALSDAVSMVQSRFNATAVKTDTVTEGGQLIYRIRLLSADKSRVWTVRVDARTGRIN